MSIGSKFALHTLWLAGPKWAAGLLHTLKTKGEQHPGLHTGGATVSSESEPDGGHEDLDWDKTLKPRAKEFPAAAHTQPSIPFHSIPSHPSKETYY